MQKFKVPQAALANAKRANALKEKAIQSNSLRSKAVLKTAEEHYKALIKEELDLDEIKSLYYFLTKSADGYKPNNREENNILNADSLAFLSSGANSALAWTRKVLKDEGVLKSYTKEITQDQIDKEEELFSLELQVQKSLKEELMQATFVVMVPEEIDLHGDVTSEDEVRKACHNFNKFCMKANLFHLVQTDSFEITESYLAPVDFSLDGKYIKKGTWLCTIQALDKGLWDLIKDGSINGVSIGANAIVEELE